ncbi:glutathione S-transferase [Comamonadaceae bacterium M7527]|nr:glutathione S-transferase [Comamonadaceae bacterium M7527]
MLKLCGFAASNYYNKVKLALLEKGVAFEESLVWAKDTDKKASALGKVPYITTPDGALCESEVILQYIERAYPQHPLVPADAFAAAKVHELSHYMDLHLELVARNLYPEAFFGGKISDSAKEKVGGQLTKNISAFTTMAKFSPFVAGDQFTIADCTALAHLPLISMATKIIYGRDYLADLPVRDYLKLLGERATVQQVTADRKANTEAMMALMKQ